MVFNRVKSFQIKKSILALTIACFPGLQKLAIVTLIMQLDDAYAVGNFATITALPLFISLLTGAGFGAKLLKLVPGESRLKQKEYFSKVAMASISYTFLAVISLLLLYVFEIIQDPITMSIYLLSISVVQLIRHYYLAARNYLALVFFDVIQLVLMVTPIFFLSDINTYIIISSLTALGFSFIWYLKVISIFRFSKGYLKDKEIFQFSANNILSAGVFSLLPLVLENFYGKAVTGEVYIIVSFFSLFLLLPRAFSNYKTPVLVELLKRNPLKFNLGATIFQKRYTMLTILCLLTSLTASSLAIHFKLTQVLNISLLSIFDLLTIVLFIFSGSFGVVQGVVLFVLGQQKYNLYSNILFFSTYFVIVALFYFIGEVSLSHFFIVSSLVSFARLPYLFLHSKKALNNTKELT